MTTTNGKLIQIKIGPDLEKQNNIVNNKPRNYEEQEKIIIQTAIEEIGLFKNKNNEVYTNKEIKEAGKLKVKARKE